ncbi:rod shape-determining protein [Micromonospora peucetia]|uniref:Rod shape-determining protein n=1 Tax=Micromonospora peucetia TaxID=47871 RepID=A0ABZ1EDL7_9ACTN|nr:rod shape-determining protein [Micromonospora peucetia]WSA32205.1 rod shape-determining protein [Micromonospora peucetia]
MLAPGAYARLGLRHPVALDLGTSTVRLWTPVSGRVVTEPAVLARMPSGGYAVGRAAMELRDTGDAKLLWPVRYGVVADFLACVHLLRVLAAASGRPGDDVSPVVVGVPATATLRQKDFLVEVVHRAFGGRVATVEEPLAAALACRADLDGDDVVAVDIGHGRTEIARIVDRAVEAAERIDVPNAIDQIPLIAAAVRRLGTQPVWPRRRRLLITGGGAAHPELAARLAALTGRMVTMPADPHLATLAGLRLLLTG